MKDDPNKRITAALAREWAAYQEEQRRKRLIRGVKAVVGFTALLVMAVAMCWYLSRRTS